LNRYVEKRDGTWVKYYYFGGQRVAMRNSGGVYWLHGDHLGSASLVTNASGGVVSQSRYTPYGSARHVSGTWPTDRRFTGQRLEGSVGLYDYNARMYSPVLARFISPDSIVPRPDDPQSFNRYAYARNSPLVRVDPTGHVDLPFNNRNDGHDCDSVLDCFGSEPQLAPMLGSLTVQVPKQEQPTGLLMAKSQDKGESSSSKSGSGGGGNGGDGLIKKIARTVGKAIASVFGFDARDGNLDTSARYMEGFGQKQRAVVNELLRELGLEHKSITFWMSKDAPRKLIASAGVDDGTGRNITLTKGFFKLSRDRQLEILREEWAHLEQQVISLAAGQARVLEEAARKSAKGGK